MNGIESIWAGELGQLQDIEDLPIEDFQGEDKGEDEVSVVLFYNLSSPYVNCQLNEN